MNETTYQIVERKLGPKGGHKDRVVGTGLDFEGAKSMAKYLRSNAPADLDYFPSQEGGRR